MADQSFHKTPDERPLDQRVRPDADEAPRVDRRSAIGQAAELGSSHPLQLEWSTEPPKAQSADLARSAGSRDGSADAAVTLQFLYGGARSVDDWLGGDVQRAANGGEAFDGGIQREAARGVAGAGGPLPHLDKIQHAFGQHDVSGVQAHVGGAAAQASQNIGARAYATGNDVAFAQQPDLHTAAHEAAHVVQQRAGVHLAGGVGAKGDRYEQHADAVADAVVSGESAEGLLDEGPSGGQSARATGASGKGGVQKLDDPDGGAGQTQNTGDPPTTDGNDTDTDQDAAGGDGDEDREPTEEEINQMVADAQSEGQTRGDETTEEGAEEAPPPAVEPEVAGGEQGGEQATETQAESPAAPQFAAVPAGPGGGLPSFQSLKSSSLSKWDDEVAWHEYFQGAGPAAGVQVNRDQLIADALSSGALAGFQAGLKNIAIDTAINMASSRIPYLQGFVEMAKIAYDPAAWLEGTLQGTYGNMVQGGAMLWEGITSGDPIAALDGLLTILEGINNVISTLSTLCWIVAAASFLLSFICPAALPFAALAANWGSALGAVATAFGVYITLGRALVIALRILQIKYGEADPQTLLQQGERLRAQTQSFTGEVTTRAGNKLRDTAQQRLQARGQQQNQSQPQQQTNTATAQPQTRMQRVMNALNTGATILTGGGSPRGATEAAFGSRNADGTRNRGAVQTALAGTRAYRGTGEYARPPGGGPRTNRQRAADMEDAGLTVFHSDRSRQRFEDHHAGKGERPAVNRELVRNHQAASERLKQARDDDAEAQRRLSDAERQAAEARARRQALEDDADTQARITATRRQHEADQARVTEAERSIQVQEHVVQTLKADRARRVSEGADPQTLIICDRHINKAEIELIDRRTTLAQARADAAASNVDRIRAQMPLSGARNLEETAEANLGTARTTAQQTGTARADAEQGVRDANAEFRTSDRIGGMSQADSDAARQRRATQTRQWYLDFTGTGPTDLHGHNKGAGITGAGGDLAANIGANAVAEVTADPKDDSQNFMGIWEKTTDGQPMDAVGTAGGRGPKEDYRGQLQERFDTLKGSLEPPPAGVPQEIDSTREAHAALDHETRQIIFQQEVMVSLLEESEASMTALDAMQQIAAANQEAVGQHQQQLGDKRTAQGALRDEANQAQGQAAEGEQSGASTAQRVGGFISGFMDMLNIVPSRLIGGSSGAAGGINQVNDSAQNQQQTSADVGATATQGVAEADRMDQETQVAEGAAQEDAASLQAASEAITAEQLATVDGQTFLQEALTNAQAEQMANEQEMAALQGRHEAAVQAGSSWAEAHSAQRVAGLGELDGIVSLVEEQDSGG